HAVCHSSPSAIGTRRAGGLTAFWLLVNRPDGMGRAKRPSLIASGLSRSQKAPLFFRKFLKVLILTDTLFFATN
ncbi:hypothetical protein, partial [Stigmatella aurantiaca]|uniref:hypothetical protein n=1 Tax=Stigmatella aurantiaca TaxID=41 RepID=UPI001E594A20